MDVAGTVAVVTGGAGGIGAALARALVDAGASVVVVDRDAERVQAVARDLGDRTRAVAGDVGDGAVISAALETARSSFGPVDIFCANAGITATLAAGDATDAQFAAAWDVNVMAHVRAARLLLPEWLERGVGYFVSTASAAGLLTQIGSAPYAVSKHAAVAFAEWLSVTYGDRGVRVSCVCPMGVNTAMLNADREAAGARAVTAAGGVLEPGEVADIVLAGIAAERFLILPHPEVLTFFQRKGSDYDRWIAGMRRLQASLS